MLFEYGEIYRFNNPDTEYNGPTWHELVGLDEAKEKFEQFAKAVRKHEFFEKTRLPFRSSLLLQGPPGTGKTTLTLAFGKKQELPVILLLPTKIIRPRLGESGVNLSKAFEFVKAEASKTPDPLILFLDEFDSLGRERDDPREIGEMKRLVNTLLTELDGLIAHHKNVIVVASTNHIKTIDSAAFRRFALQIDFTLPSRELRFHIWSEFERRLKTDVSGIEWDLETLVNRTDGYTAADIERLVLGAVMQYLYQNIETISTDLLLQQLDYVVATSNHIDEEKRSDFLDLGDIDWRGIKGIADAAKMQYKRS